MVDDWRWSGITWVRFRLGLLLMVLLLVLLLVPLVWVVDLLRHSYLSLRVDL